MIHPKKKSDAWTKLRKERKKFSKLLIFSTDCSQSTGLQSVIKNLGQNCKTFCATRIAISMIQSGLDHCNTNDRGHFLMFAWAVFDHGSGTGRQLHVP
jgi:hypothetical protein